MTKIYDPQGTRDLPRGKGKHKPGKIAPPHQKTGKKDLKP